MTLAWSLHLVAHFPHGRVQAQAAFHAHDQQVEGVGQRQEDRLLPLAAQIPQDDARQVEADPGQNSNGHCKVLKSIGRPGTKIANDTQEKRQQAGKADAGVDHRGRVAAEAGVGQLDLQGDLLQLAFAASAATDIALAVSIMPW